MLLKHALVRNMSCLDPQTFVRYRKKPSNITKMSYILMLLADCGRITTGRFLLKNIECIALIIHL